MEAPAADSPDQRRAAKILRRHARNLRKAGAEGFLAGVAAMLRPGDLAVDCGANVGEVTAVLAATGADVVAFEPDPQTFSRLAARFADRPNVTLVEAAVGTGAGTARLMRADGFDTRPGGASVKSTILHGGRQIDAANAVEVRVVDFPAWLAGQVAARGEVAFVKMDIEGAELDLLEALEAQGGLARVRCLVAETHERKFRHLRPRYAALKARFAAGPDAARHRLDWI